ncbi:hypothetical protein AHiyo8_48460 [Arthrobacter sp. Hiyo8]|nr:hypothetical protein AHiyo8_48460 [Arthrobacter sp. Hiyo8]
MNADLMHSPEDQAAETLTLSDVTVGAANYMLGYLQMTISADQSITPAKWREALIETVEFQHRTIALQQPLEPPC